MPLVNPEDSLAKDDGPHSQKERPSGPHASRRPAPPDTLLSGTIGVETKTRRPSLPRPAGAVLVTRPPRARNLGRRGAPFWRGIWGLRGDSSAWEGARGRVP